MHVSEISIPADTRPSLSTRVSWGAIVSGVVVALSMQFLLTLLGVASGLSLGDKVGSNSMQIGAVIYVALTLFASLFVGGVVTSLLTGRENTQEAVLSGLVMWGVAFLAVLFLGSAGIQGSANVFTAATNARNTAAPNWEASARDAGVTNEQIADWRAKSNGAIAKAQDPQAQQEALNTATRAAWYGFFITWISMVFAALGGWVGAGKTFRFNVISGNMPAYNANGRLAERGVNVPANGMA